MISVNLIIVLLVGSIVGALTGAALGGLISALYLAMIAGVLATIVAGIVRNTIMTRVGNEPNMAGIPQLMIIYSAVAIDRRIPFRVIVYSALASLAGSVSAVEITQLNALTSPVLLGTLAGLFAGVLMSILMLVYEIHPKPSESAEIPATAPLGSVENQPLKG
jgi:hypothetical protein